MPKNPRRTPGKVSSKADQDPERPRTRPKQDPPSESPSKAYKTFTEEERRKAMAVRAGMEVKRWSIGETRVHQRLVESGLLQGMDRTTIRDQLATQGHQVSLHRVDVLIDRVREQWSQEDMLARPFWKAAQTRRIMQHIALAKFGREADIAKKIQAVRPSLTALKGFEDLLADVQGTKEPIVIDINVQHTEALIGVLGTMTREQLAENYKKHLETKALAASAKLAGLQPLDVPYENVG